MRALIALLLLAAAGDAEQVIPVTARKYEFAPAVIELKVGVPVILELHSADRRHGFASPDLHVDEQVEPGEVKRIRIVPDKAGTFEFHCSVFCGSGHEDMSGQVVVKP